MSALPQHNWTAAEYLAFERDSEFKHEFINGEVVASSTNAILYNQLGERDCEIYPSDMRVHVPATGLCAYPDVTVMCGEAKLLDDQFDTLLNPTVIIEVLSPSTESDNRGRKFQGYRSIPTLRDYLLLSQDQPRAEHYTRQPDDTWLLRDLIGTNAVVELASIQCRLPLEAVYRRISFEDGA